MRRHALEEGDAISVGERGFPIGIGAVCPLTAKEEGAHGKGDQDHEAGPEYEPTVAVNGEDVGMHGRGLSREQKRTSCYNPSSKHSSLMNKKSSVEI
jgi:hypothetical protein